jgi:hypothetical protein
MHNVIQVDVADNISIGLKLFFCFLSPSVGLTMGVIVIESYLFSHGNPMNYHFINNNWNYPDLNNILTVLLVSALGYFLITLVSPLDWIWNYTGEVEYFLFPKPDYQAINKQDDMHYPCDAEDEAGEEDLEGTRNDVLLDVNALTQVYPDGTAAVKDMSFKVKQGKITAVGFLFLILFLRISCFYFRPFF